MSADITRSFSLADVKSGLAQHVEEICRYLLPAGKRQGNYWTCGSVQGEPGRSLYVRLAGAKCGTWRDAATGDGGSILDLIMQTRGISLAEAIDEALELLKFPRLAPPSLHQDEAWKTEKARQIWNESLPAAGTAVEAYLRGRCITILPATIRFHPALRIDGDLLPAMVAAVYDCTETVIGIHRTYLGPDGRQAAVHSPKRTLGRMAGGAVRLAPIAARMGIAEGIETALAAMQMFDIPTWAMLGTAGVERPVLPAEIEEIVIFADGDRPGQKAAKKGAKLLRDQGRSVEIAWAPEGQDFADVLFESASRGFA